ncbi:unnamed protein product [Oikopleura dioica]|uniref:Uncharacterized protein n=1 Tax=Oikopleura dioica TaxID=34765 RepID=E4WS92_OIKDI|nr:unnamed protein product [Oikopleura dioica]CBY43746.1 unnamed protein product [Oikopleura dioica]
MKLLLQSQYQEEEEKAHLLFALRNGCQLTLVRL